MNNVLEISNVTKDYKKFKIDNISFNLKLNISLFKTEELTMITEFKITVNCLKHSYK